MNDTAKEDAGQGDYDYDEGSFELSPADAENRHAFLAGVPAEINYMGSLSMEKDIGRYEAASRLFAYVRRNGSMGSYIVSPTKNGRNEYLIVFGAGVLAEVKLLTKTGEK
jgi:hypothetical protein